MWGEGGRREASFLMWILFIKGGDLHIGREMGISSCYYGSGCISRR